MLTSPVIIRSGTSHGPLAGVVHGFTDLVIAGLARLDRPWQQHARRNAYEAVAALRRDARERRHLPARSHVVRPTDGNGLPVGDRASGRPS